MTKTFTPDDLLRYVYNETTDLENTEIQEAILVNADLAESLKELNALKYDLECVQFYPSKRSVHNILKYAKTISLHASPD